MKIGPVESQNHFLWKETIKTRSYMVKMMVYIRKTDHKQCFGTKHHFHGDKIHENWTSKIGKPFSIDSNGQNQVPYGQNDGLYKDLSKIYKR